MGHALVVLPHALWQAYSPSAARAYSSTNGLPSLPELLAGLAALCGFALALRLTRVGPALAAALSRHRTQVAAGAIVVLVVLVLLGLGWERVKIFGIDQMSINGVRTRSYDEIALQRLSWFFTRPVFLFAVGGVVVVALQRWSSALWALVIPTLLVSPVYLWHAKNDAWLMWWPRRFVPIVVPGLLMLVGCSSRRPGCCSPALHRAGPCGACAGWRCASSGGSW